MKLLLGQKELCEPLLGWDWPVEELCPYSPLLHIDGIKAEKHTITFPRTEKDVWDVMEYHSARREGRHLNYTRSPNQENPGEANGGGDLPRWPRGGAAVSDELHYKPSL